MNFLVAIPARFESTRFPGKPLALIDGVTMIERVIRGVLTEKRVSHIAVMTDDARIKECVEKFTKSVEQKIKIEAVMTSKDCATGTDRIHEGLIQLEQQGQKFDFVLNVQGDVEVNREILGKKPTHDKVLKHFHDDRYVFVISKVNNSKF